MANDSAEWQAVLDHDAPKLSALFEADNERVDRLTVELAGLRFDFAKTHLDPTLLSAFGALAETRDLAGRRDAFLSGAVVNPSEGRAAEHPAERGTGSDDAVAEAAMLHRRMRGLVEAIGEGVLGKVKHVLHIGIGGSALGPRMLVDALGRDMPGCDVRVVSNVDGAALAEAIEGCDPERTLIAVASKTFTTSETMLNAASALGWLEERGVADPYGRVVALTAAPNKALEWGVDEMRILPFRESVGGRYSLWSSIGFPAALALGSDAFQQLLDGARAMDEHFATTPFARNAPVLAAFADLFYAQAKGCQTRAVFAYDERLRLLPDYLQQLEMESNGKRVTADGAPLGRPSAPITWGGVGTDAQHAVFQLLHQGTHLVPVEFIAAKEPGHELDPAHHEALLTNCFAQGAALMAGRSSDDGNRDYPGDRPSSTILLDDVTPFTLGALIAFYEHRTFVNATMIGINPFDQFGVELGKDMARAVGGDSGSDAFDASTRALIAAALG